MAAALTSIGKWAKRGIEKSIRELRLLEREAFRGRHGRTDFYGYLEAVLREYWSWADENLTQRRRDQVCFLYDIAPRRDADAFTALLAASAMEHPAKVRSRWAQALRFAGRHRATVEKTGLRAFLEANGGVAGAARLHAASSKAGVRAARWGKRGR